VAPVTAFFSSRPILTSDEAASTLLPMSIILLTNDDGIHAPGIDALHRVLDSLGEVWVVAPHIERSACSRSVTLNKPLRVTELGNRRFSVDGTSADCVLLAFRSLIEPKPEIVVAGINRGLNVGEDLDYSGTVGAAFEAALQGARISLAISASSDCSADDVRAGAELTRILLLKLKDHPPPQACVINVNLPRRHTKKIRWTRQGNPLGMGAVVIADDPRGKKYYWIAERPDEDAPPPDTDRGAIKEGCISLTMLTLDRNWRGEWEPPSLWKDGYTEEVP